MKIVIRKLMMWYKSGRLAGDLSPDSPDYSAYSLCPTFLMEHHYAASCVLLVIFFDDPTRLFYALGFSITWPSHDTGHIPSSYRN